MDELDGFHHRRTAAVHRADLHQLLVARRRLDHLAAFPHRVRRGLFDEDVLAGLQGPDGGERVPVIRYRDHDGIDVFVVEGAAEVLHEPRLERLDVLEAFVVDPRRREVGVDVAERLDFDVLQPREAALEGVALTADADLREDDAIVGADDAAGRPGCRADARPQQVAADRYARRRRSELRVEDAPRNALLVLLVAGHGDLLDSPNSKPSRARKITRGNVCRAAKMAPEGVGFAL